MIVQQDYYTDPRVRRYAEALADAGASVDVLCAKCAAGPESDYRRDIRVYPIPVTHGSTSIMGYVGEYLLSFLCFSVYLWLLQIRRNYHVVHAHNMPDFLTYCALLSRLLGTKVILDVHDPMPEFFMSKYDVREATLLVRLLRVQERLSSALADRVITANENFKVNLCGRGTPATKVVVVKNIADTRIFDRRVFPRARGGEGRFVLLYTGTIAPRYGLEMPIRAMLELKRQIPHVLLRIVGPHSRHRDELEELVRHLELGSWVEILPAVPIQKIPELMSQADLGIYTAIEDPHMAIATPTKVLEYAQMGLPVVASRLRIVEQIFGPEGVAYVPSDDPQAFAAVVRELWEDPRRYEALSASADRVFVQQNSWEAERNVYFALLDEMVPLPGKGRDGS
jgi:glycosyltransferase involved in cell wall biosynthesis